MSGEKQYREPPPSPGDLVLGAYSNKVKYDRMTFDYRVGGNSPLPLDPVVMKPRENKVSAESVVTVPGWKGEGGYAYSFQSRGLLQAIGASRVNPNTEFITLPYVAPFTDSTDVKIEIKCTASQAAELLIAALSARGVADHELLAELRHFQASNPTVIDIGSATNSALLEIAEEALVIQKQREQDQPMAQTLWYAARRLMKF